MYSTLLGGYIFMLYLRACIILYLNMHYFNCMIISMSYNCSINLQEFPVTI